MSSSASSFDDEDFVESEEGRVAERIYHLTIEELYNLAKSTVEDAIKKDSGWANIKLDTAIKLHDVLLQLRHWGNDIRNHQVNVLKQLESDDSPLAETVRFSLIDLVRTVEDLHKFFNALENEENRQNSSATEIEAALSQSLTDSLACVLLQVEPLRTLLDVHKKTGMPGAVEEAVLALNNGSERERNQSEAEKTGPEPEDGKDLAHLLRTKSLTNVEYKTFWPTKLLTRIVTRSRVSKILVEKLSVADQRVVDDYTNAILTGGEDDTEACGFLHIFVILVLMEKVEWIGSFIDADLGDNELPLRKAYDDEGRALLIGKGSSIRPFESWKSSEMESFYKIQWQVHVPFFDFDLQGPASAKHFTFEDDTILPWSEQIPCSVDDFSRVDRIKVDKDSHAFHANSSFEALHDEYVTVKTLTKKSQFQSRDEVAALNTARRLPSKHLIRLLATFSLQNRQHLIFPWALYNLKHYWEMNHGPLVSPNVSVIAEIRWVSGQIRGIIEAIHAMHNSGLRHGNLKPQNILLRVSKEDPQGTLVITDIGSSPRFHPEKSTSNTSAESIFIDPIYRPPEFDIPGSFISRSADIWSLGCIFFEMACWLLGGEDLRRSCEEARASLDSAGFPSYTFFEFITSVKQGGDGQSRQYAQVKEGVTERFEALRTHPRCTPYVHDFLSLTQDQMLVMNDERTSSRELLMIFNRLHARVERDVKYAAQGLARYSEPLTSQMIETTPIEFEQANLELPGIVKSPIPIEIIPSKSAGQSKHEIVIEKAKEGLAAQEFPSSNPLPFRPSSRDAHTSSPEYDDIELAISRRSTFYRALADFAAKAHELSKKAVDGRSYVLVGELRQWMRGMSLSKLDNKFVTNTDLLAHAAYFGRHDFPPIVSSHISDAGPDCCVVVFGILLDLELGHLINLFSKKGIVDSQLPQDLSSLKRKLTSLKPDERVAERFNERQWKFCPATFSLNMEKEYVEDIIIPICRQAHLSSGGTARVSQIVVQSEFIDKKLQNLLAGDAHASYIDRDHGPCYLFALKTFKEGCFQHYHDEKAAFDGLRGSRGIIRCLGCFSHRSLLPSAANNGHANEERRPVEAKDTMNLLLEFGTYDLSLYFGHTLPPVFPKEILAFWEALFEVADAVSGIHEFKAGGSEFYGWHADIKPDNIIYVRGKFKLADPGFARFKKKPQDKGAAPQIRVHGGTYTYGAPEASSKATVHQTIDTWSLGCVFSMAATWLILGYQGVCQYQHVREKALGSLLKTIKEDGHALLVSQGLKAGTKPEKLDCFHNGTNVLREITSWHTLLRSSARKTDPITEEVLNLIDQKMLLQDPKQRIESRLLCEELRRIVSSSKMHLRESIDAESPEAQDDRRRMEGLLGEIDKEAATQIVEDVPPEPTRPFAPGLPVDRDALKVQLEHVALKKTSHRFETIPGPRRTPIIPDTVDEKPTIVTSDTIGLKEVLHQSVTPPESAVISTADKRKSVRRSTFGQPSRTNTGTATLPYQKTGIEPPAHAIQNVIQARESMDRDLKRKGTSLGGMLAKKKPRKDEYLSKHFKHRDIKFLVDDAETMAEHWDEATFLLETLVMKAHGQDPDGPDLIFTNDGRELKREKDAAAFRRVMQSVRPRKGNHVHTNLKTALTPIFNNYLSMVRQTNNKSKVSALTVIVLTDGLWKGMADQNEITDKIVLFYKQLTQKMDGMMQDRQVSIQFIQLGDDEEARERLRRLDIDMLYRGVEDMIDVEKFSVTGNVFKMLLGSFVEEMDAINDSVEELFSLDESPPFQATGSNPANNLPLRSISEGTPEDLIPHPGYMYDMQQTPPMQQKPKKSRPFSGLFSGQSR